MSSILFEKIGGVAKLTLNRPDVFNSFNREMALLLQDLLEQIGTDPSIRAVYLTGAGRAFSAGQDLNEVMDQPASGFINILEEHYNPIVRQMRALPRPIVVAVNGVAAGAGANLALLGDVVVASANAAFIQAFSKIGLIPDTGGTYFLPRLIGWQRASALMLLGDKVGAEEAAQLGLIYRVFPAADFERESWALAEKLAQMPTRGLAFTKQALQQSLHHTLEEQLAVEVQLQMAAAHTADYAEGVKAFLEKRTPEFKGE